MKFKDGVFDYFEPRFCVELLVQCNNASQTIEGRKASQESHLRSLSNP